MTGEGGGRRGPFGGGKLEDLFDEKGMESLHNLRRAEEALHAKRMVERLFEELRGVVGATGSLVQKVDEKKGSIEAHLEQSRKIFDPNFGKPFGDLVDVSGYGSLEFIRKVGAQLHGKFEPVYRELFLISELYNSFVKSPFNGRSTTTGDLRRVLESIEQITSLTLSQIEKGILSYEKVVGAAYAAIQLHHKDLRSRYQSGDGSKKHTAESIFDLLLGKGDDKPEHNASRIGSRISLIDNNCVLTDTLMDLVNNLPVHQETVVPIGKNGRTKVLRKLDDYEVQNSARVLAEIANPIYIKYLKDPNLFPAAIANSIRAFYLHYKEFEPSLRNILEAVQDVEHIKVRIMGDDFYKSMADPSRIVNRLQGLNFMSIKPALEEVQPRTKIEKDYAYTRSRLLYHLRDSLDRLVKMQGDDERREEVAIKDVKAAVTLKEKMEEIIKTERERRLRKDIRGENEFYVGRTGKIGEFYSEREPAPQIKYKEVVGASFNLAKAHIEEVIDLASFPHIVKASAPRGKIKSNVLLIGPYGCGKSEFARAVAGDRRVIGLYVSVADVLTAYMHESVKNVKRVWEEGKRLRQESRYTKPVALIQDEFDAWFERGDRGFRHSDEQQMERVLQEVLDGLIDYDGVFTIALTNKPGVIPDGILRRFKYVDIVGQLTHPERTGLLKYFLTRGMPVSAKVKNADYQKWAERLADAPGDVLGKIADEVHFKYIREYRHANQNTARSIERYLTRIENERDLTRIEYSYVKRQLAEYRRVNKPEIEEAINYMLRQPAIQKMINEARKVYSEADKIMQGLMVVGEEGMGFGRKAISTIWGKDR